MVDRRKEKREKEEKMTERRPTPDEIRAARLRAGRAATRAVRRTLLAVAIFAAIYYCFLLATQKKDAPTNPVDDAPTTEATAAP